MKNINWDAERTKLWVGLTKILTDRHTDRQAEMAHLALLGSQLHEASIKVDERHCSSKKDIFKERKKTFGGKFASYIVLQ